MKTLALLLAAAGLLDMSSAQAADYFDQARVTDVRTLSESVVEPVRDCVPERYPQRGDAATSRPTRGYAGPVFGGIVGALAGSQVGAGSGKAVATAAGAIAGTLIGDHLENDRSAAADEPVTQMACHTARRTRVRTIGYDVSYDYQGRIYHTTLPRDPGAHLPVRVTVTPALDRFDSGLQER